MKNIVLTSLLLGLLLCVQSLPAKELPLWEVGAGASLLSYPDYRGADHSNTLALPLPYAVYRGERLRLNRDGLRAKLFGLDRLSVNLSIAASLPSRNSNDDSPRVGMPKLLSTFEIGPSFDYWLLEPAHDQWDLRLRLPLRAVAATDFRQFDTPGWLTHPHLQLGRRMQMGEWEWSSSASVGALWASREYHAYFYQVDPQFATAERPAYRAHAGYSGARASAYIGLSRNAWRIALGVLVDDLDGASFDDSPLVQRHSAAVIGLGVAYRFWRSNENVVIDDDDH